MYVVTFYSFKGGVGRSIAMMNCAAHLVEQKKRVLLVDFDLEAPGLDTFSLDWEAGKTRKGLVDYVTKYLNTEIAPELDDYVHKGSFNSEANGTLWLMPAGERKKNYHQRLNSINWRDLYDFNDGYFLFENLKAQWKKSLNPDYVLIDSRTGHTDVGSICTRQIPDAVVLLFFPNRQNLSGLIPIVDRVREQNIEGSKELVMHFVTSNVPDIDDEHSILWSRLQEFQKNLKYKKLAATIHHYQDLSLLNQEIFTISRPKSRLASEYSDLVKEIQKFNAQDRNGAIFYLKDVVSNPYGNQERNQDETDKVDQNLKRILDHHINDFEILNLVVRHLGWHDEEQAYQILKENWDRFKDIPSYLILHSRFASRLGEKKESVNSIIAATKHKNLNFRELKESVRFLLSHDDSVVLKQLESIVTWESVLVLDPIELLNLADLFSFRRRNLKTAEQLLQRCIQLACDETQFEQKIVFKAQDNLMLSLIGQRKFDEAIDWSEKLSSNIDYEWSIPNVFNLAMAQWGKTQIVPIEDFKYLAEIVDQKRSSGANFSQCMSLVYWALSDFEKAQENLDEARNQLRFKEFSSWTYLYSRRAEFKRDLESQQRMLNGEDVLPAIVSPA